MGWVVPIRGQKRLLTPGLDSSTEMPWTGGICFLVFALGLDQRCLFLAGPWLMDLYLGWVVFKDPLRSTTSPAPLSPAGSCFWVAVLDGNVVGIVAARGNEEDNTLELRRMSVDSKYRGKGIAKALGRKVLEFAMLNNYSSVVLGTTAVKVAAHKLYESLGFKHVGIVEHYTLPGMTHSLLERMFFQLRYHRYRLQLREE
uniref:N-acetylaspartate synthetase n=1 Tax=Crocodylus porosus TaxID=8502 RepID=A0A7M4DZK8_CROPO